MESVSKQFFSFSGNLKREFIETGSIIEDIYPTPLNKNHFSLLPQKVCKKIIFRVKMTV